MMELFKELLGIFKGDISLSTIFISGTIAVVGWLVKAGLNAGMNLLIEYIKKLLLQLDKTSSDVAVLTTKHNELVQAIGDVQKIRYDLNGFYARLKALEEKQ